VIPASPRARLRVAQRLAALLERGCGIATPDQQFDALLQKTDALVPAGVALEAYLEQLELDDAALQRFIEGMCTHETRFFRHPEHFEIVSERWVPARRADTRSRKVRAWSVACSSGEEPFSLAMLLLDNFPSSAGWSVEVLATDVSSLVLERARGATWPLSRSGEISAERLDRYMLRGRYHHVGLMRAKPALRSAVRLQQLNLISRPYALGDDFDLVFLRNVLIYFSAQTRRRVLDGVLAAMAPGAMLVTGPAEGVSYLAEDRLRSVGPHVFVYSG
jgi:chemotaxis protein methyltransferase CheR